MPLNHKLIQHIQKEGPLSIASYMDICLMDPTAGYYTKHVTIGPTGDFLTAPEISQLFGEILGIWVLQQWHNCGQPSPWQLIELGPGYGTLMHDIYRVFQMHHLNTSSCHTHLLEASPLLQAKQKEKLSPHPSIHWHKDWSSLKCSLKNLPTFIVANEFFDALPTHQYEKIDHKWYERKVDWHEEKGFHLLLDPTSWTPHASIPKETSFIETSPARLFFAEEIAHLLKKYTGAAALIDYGYETGYGDTFQALKNHTAVDPLKTPGQADITAHVDFGALQSILKNTSLETRLETQASFLENNGIALRLQQLLRHAKTPEEINYLRRAFQRLTSKKEMGSLFKVLTTWQHQSNS